MDMVQEAFLSMLRNPVFKQALFSPALWYLLKKLRVDTGSLAFQGYSNVEVLIAVGKKLREDDQLLAYKLIRFYRSLRRDELITSKQLQRLEEEVFHPTVKATEQTHIEIPGYSSPGIFFSKSHPTLQVTFVFRKPLPLPWDHDQHFFEKHPQHKAALLDIGDHMSKLDWYREIWLAMTERLSDE